MARDPDISQVIDGAGSITRIKLGSGPNRQAGGVALGVIAAVVLLVLMLCFVGELRWLVPWVVGGGALFALLYLALLYAFAFRHPVAASLDSVDYARVLTKDVGMMGLPDGGTPVIDLTPIENPRVANLDGGDA